MAESVDLNKENQEIIEFPGKAKSKVWNYFGFVKERKPDGPPQIHEDKAVCKICSGAYKYTGGTTNLAVHLEHAHGINIKEGRSVEKQPTISAAFKGVSGGAMGPIPLVKKSLIDKKLQEFIIRDVVPLSTVDGSGFVELIKACEPR